ncbi:YtxH domain-containing protein [Georgenia sp. Z1344]|uniref:YtxH domain-containing protein n=1 Tax=Georgenia sp. Z1344 TaxID=3416706 RepID=UPI003CE935FA
MSKVSFLVGLGVGFVLGARAGRGQYEKMKRQATQIWENPKVAEVREQAAEKAEELAKQAPGAAASAARTAKDKVGEAVEERRERSATDDAAPESTGPSPAVDAGIKDAPNRADTA